MNRIEVVLLGTIIVLIDSFRIIDFYLPYEITPYLIVVQMVQYLMYFRVNINKDAVTYPRMYVYLVLQFLFIFAFLASFSYSPKSSILYFGYLSMLIIPLALSKEPVYVLIKKIEKIMVIAILLAVVANALLLVLLPQFGKDHGFESRFPSFMLSPNGFSLYLLVALIFSVYKRSMIYSRLRLPLFFIILVLGISAGSRSFMLVFAVILGMYFIIELVVYEKLTAPAFVLISVLLMLFFYGDTVLIRFEKHGWGVDAERNYVWSAIFEYLMNAPIRSVLFGSGIGFVADNFSHSAHNQFIKDLVEFGVFYVATLTLLMISYFVKLWHAKLDKSDVFKYTSVPIVLILYSMTYTPVASVNTINIGFMLWVYWVLLFVSLFNKNMEKNNESYCIGW